MFSGFSYWALDLDVGVLSRSKTFVPYRVNRRGPNDQEEAEPCHDPEGRGSTKCSNGDLRERTSFLRGICYGSFVSEFTGNLNSMSVRARVSVDMFRNRKISRRGENGAGNFGMSGREKARTWGWSGMLGHRLLPVRDRSIGLRELRVGKEIPAPSRRRSERIDRQMTALGYFDLV